MCRPGLERRPARGAVNLGHWLSARYYQPSWAVFAQRSSYQILLADATAGCRVSPLTARMPAKTKATTEEVWGGVGADLRPCSTGAVLPGVGRLTRAVSGLAIGDAKRRDRGAR